MAQIKQLKDTTGNFYPVTHKDAIVGIEDIQVDMTGYATEQWVENKGYLTEHQDISGKVDVTDFEEATLVTSVALNTLNLNLADKEAIITGIQSDVSSLSTRVENLENNGVGSADLTNYYTKELTDAKVEEVASVAARAVNEIKKSIGASDELKVSFEDTKHLSSAESIMDALHILDEGIESEELNNRISTIESNIAIMQQTIDSLSAMLSSMISISAEGADSSYTMTLVGSYGGGGKSGIEDSALIAAGEIENNALVLTGATIEGSALYL